MVYETRTMCTVHCLLLLWVYGVWNEDTVYSTLYNISVSVWCMRRGQCVQYTVYYYCECMRYETRTMCTVHCLLLLWVYGVVRDEGPDWGGEDGQHPANQKVDLLVPRQYSLCHHVHRTGNIISRITRIILNIRNKIKVEMFFFIYILLFQKVKIFKRLAI